METENQRKFRHFRRDVRHGVQYLAALVPIYILIMLPYRLALKLGGILGSLAFMLVNSERERAVSQMTRALGERYNHKEIRVLVKGCFIHLGKSLVEVLQMKRLDRDQFFNRISCDNEEVLQEVLRKGKGVIIITGHIGNWEYMAAYLGQKGYPLTVLARESPVPAFDRFMTEIRTRAGFRPLNRGTLTSAKESLRVLKKGKILGILIDQDTKVDGVFVDFFGQLAWTPVGAASMALKTGSPVIVGSINRKADDSHVIHFSAPRTYIASSDKKEDQLRITAELTKELERIITECPDQWVWMHRRWKTRPDGKSRV